jgi:hypothetical protein
MKASICFLNFTARFLIERVRKLYILPILAQVSYLTLAASMSIVLLPLRLIAPAIFVPPLARACAYILI